MSEAAARAAIDAVWRIESDRLIAGLTRMVGDLGMAEDLAQDALLLALEKWPESGVPDNPGAWLMATAKHRALDHFPSVEDASSPWQKYSGPRYGATRGARRLHRRRPAAPHVHDASSRCTTRWRRSNLRRSST